MSFCEAKGKEFNSNKITQCVDYLKRNNFVDGKLKLFNPRI